MGLEQLVGYWRTIVLKKDPLRSFLQYYRATLSNDLFDVGAFFNYTIDHVALTNTCLYNYSFYSTI